MRSNSNSTVAVIVILVISIIIGGLIGLAGYLDGAANMNKTKAGTPAAPMKAVAKTAAQAPGVPEPETRPKPVAYPKKPDTCLKCCDLPEFKARPEVLGKKRIKGSPPMLRKGLAIESVASFVVQCMDRSEQVWTEVIRQELSGMLNAVTLDGEVKALGASQTVNLEINNAFTKTDIVHLVEVLRVYLPDYKCSVVDLSGRRWFVTLDYAGP